MENSSDNRIRLIALALTLLLGVLLTLVLTLTTVAAPAPGELPDAAQDEEEIFFTDIEYEDITVNPTPMVDGQAAAASGADISGTELTNQGEGEEAPQLVASTEPSEAKQQAQPPVNPGPPTDPDEERRAAIGSRTAGAFTTNPANQSGSGSGDTEQGRATTGSNPGADGLGLDGRKRLNTPQIALTNVAGTVTMEIVVDHTGKVLSATFKNTSGFGAREAEVREAVKNASMQLLYSPLPSGNTSTQRGTITWTLRLK